jgi:hypothetical protein
MYVHVWMYTCREIFVDETESSLPCSLYVCTYVYVGMYVHA